MAVDLAILAAGALGAVTLAITFVGRRTAFTADHVAGSSNAA